jgi:hypothetical protein
MPVAQPSGHLNGRQRTFLFRDKSGADHLEVEVARSNGKFKSDAHVAAGSAARSLTNNSVWQIQQLINMHRDMLGEAYRYLDCSALVQSSVQRL